MVERCERKWLLTFALLVMLLTSLPYLLAYQLAGSGAPAHSAQADGWRFTGFVFGVEDGNSYIAKMLIGTSGSWLFRTPYTAYPQRGALFFTFYILLGKLAAQPGAHEQLVALFHLLRVVGGGLAILATYDFSAVFLKEARWRRLATVLAVLGGGLGWLVIFGLNGLWKGGLPLEYYSPEAFGFLSIFGLPHLAFARAFLLWGLRDYLLSTGGLVDGRAWLRGGLLWLGAWIMQPMSGAIALVVIGVHLALTGAALRFLGPRGVSPAARSTAWQDWRQHFINALRIAIIVLPPVAFTFLSFKLDPFLSQWEQQNRLPSPPFHEYILAYAVALPLALLGMAGVLREHYQRGALLVGWALVYPLLAYLPFTTQRRLVEGVWVALSILAVRGVVELGPWLRRVSYGWLALAFPATLFLWLGALITVSRPAEPLFLPAGEVSAFNALAGQARPGEVVLASFATANPLPAWAPLHTLLGHGPESINGPALQARVACFYRSACPEADRQALLDEFRVAYVFWGPNEKVLGDWDPNNAAYLKRVYQQGAYQLFQVTAGPGN